MGVRHVRDASYWGMPVGTPIVKGMKPARAKMAKGGSGGVLGTLARAGKSGPAKPNSRGTAAQRMAASKPGGAWASMAAARKSEPAPIQRLSPTPEGGFKPNGTVTRGEAARIMHGPTGKPKPRKSPAPKAPTAKAPAKPAAAGSSAQVEAAKADVLATAERMYSETPGAGHRWIGMAKLRDRLSKTHSREDVDQAVKDLVDEGVMRGTIVANVKALTQRDRDAAVVMGMTEVGVPETIDAVYVFTPGELAEMKRQATQVVDAPPSAREQLAEANARRAKRGLQPMDRSEIRDFLPQLSAAELDQLAGAPAAKNRGQQVEDEIRSAVAALAGEPGGYVSLEDVRARLGDRYTRTEVDQALDDMFLKPGVALTPEANQKTLTPSRRAAAVNIGMQDQHLISISGVGGAKPAPAKAAKKATSARAKMAGAKSGLPDGLSPQGAVDRLKGMSKRTDGEQFLATASRADLTAIFESGGWSYAKNANKTQLRQSLVELLIGRRIDSDAIMRAGRSS